MAQQSSRGKRILRGVGFFVLAAVLLLYIGLPAGMGIYTVLPHRDPVGQPPEGYETVTLPTEDGVQLKGWYLPPQNGAAVILLHGAGNAREGVRRYAQMLAEHGYGVLAVDLRGHGESEGITNRFGWQGTQDVGAAVAFLQQRSGEVQRIGGLGISLGGEVLLGAASQYPEIQAIAADGATQRCPEELMALESERPLVRNFTARVMYLTVQLATGTPPPKPLLNSMVEAPATRYYLIAGGSDVMEVRFNQLFASTLRERAALWVAPGASHTAAFARYPEEYEQRVVTFFNEALLPPAQK